MANVVLALSGGLDSSVMVAQANKEHNILLVTFRYRSKHNFWESLAARKIMLHYKLDGIEVNAIDCFIGSKSALMSHGDIAIPEADFNDPVQKQTIVPGRNLVFASILAGLAQSQFQKSEVWLGMHVGDFAIYPDCTPTWYENVYRAIYTQSEGRVILRAPWIDEHLDKAGIVKKGLELRVPFELTRTCYKDQEIACGKCGACRERIEAFEKNKTHDPLPYQDDQYNLS